MNSVPESSGWRRFWFASVPATQYLVARSVLAATALWVLLSRPGWPRMMDLPPDFWSGVTFTERLRFFYFGTSSTETVVYWAAVAATAMALAGIAPRLSCFAAGLLLYHLAPLETIVWSPNPYLRGLTIPVLGLLVLSFGEGGGVGYRSSNRFLNGWQLRLIQVFICQIYLFAGYSKLFMSGPSWMSAENMRGTILALDQVLGYAWEETPGAVLRSVPEIASTIGVVGLLFDLIFPLVLFSRVARWILLPSAAVFHLLNHWIFHITFPGIFWLLIFIRWGESVRIGEDPQCGT